METLAKHLLVELHDCDAALLDDLPHMTALLKAGAAAARATIVGEAFHRYAPHGVTGVLVLEESHFSVHTWPEASYAALDFYTCGSLDPEPAARIVAEGVKAQAVTLLEVARGLPRGEGGISLARRSAW